LLTIWTAIWQRGTKKREAYEQEFEAFKLGVLIQEMREKQNLTQEQLARKVRYDEILHSRIETMQATSPFHTHAHCAGRTGWAFKML
jgi:ribosome-binding protein aMBF1 (putative translation factor)